MKRICGSSECYRYEITVSGHVRGGLAGAFEGLAVRLTPEGQSILTCPPLDQAALFGLLIRIRDCGLPLVAVVRMESEVQHV